MGTPETFQKALPAIRLRQEELRIYYSCLRLIFEKYFCPVIRLPQGVQTDIQKEIDTLINSKSDKKTRAYIDLIKKEEEYTKEYSSIINTTKKIPTVKIYSDGPVEFIRDTKNKLPILLSTTLCKIPTTPGNTFFNSVSMDLDLFIGYKELFEILIIRSYDKNDENKQILEDCIKQYDNPFNNIHYTIEDVANCNEVIEALEKHKNTKIVIFDCHGHQGKNEIFGSLVIGKEYFNIWKYVEKNELINVPPIVMFSACNTFPMGNTFNSIANGFLAAGTKSVIATNTNVKFIDSGVFIGRILYRIDELLPVIIKNRKIITWLEFISDFFRMSYITDVTRYFIEKQLLDENGAIEISYTTNININMKNPNWYSLFISDLANRTNRTKKECQEIVCNEIGFTETMKYIILGNADSIIIHDD